MDEETNIKKYRDKINNYRKINDTLIKDNIAKMLYMSIKKEFNTDVYHILSIYKSIDENILLDDIENELGHKLSNKYINIIKLLKNKNYYEN